MSTKKQRILVVDDEAAITELVSMALRYEEYDADVAHSGIDALRQLEKTVYDLVVLDVMMPEFDGFEVCRILRSTSDTRALIPIIFLTAKDALDDRLTGLTLGADDYVTKPFSVAELVARVRTVLRRVARGGDAPRHTTLTCGDLILNEDTRDVTRAGEPVMLTPTEFRVLHYLMMNTGRALSKQQILNEVWGYEQHGNENVVEAYISYLRRKIDTHAPPLIHTIRGVGYTLRLPRGAEIRTTHT